MAGEHASEPRAIQTTVMGPNKNGSGPKSCIELDRCEIVTPENGPLTNPVQM